MNIYISLMVPRGRHRKIAICAFCTPCWPSLIPLKMCKLPKYFYNIRKSFRLGWKVEGSNFYAFLHKLGHTERREDDLQFNWPAQQGLEMSSVFPVTASQCEMYRTIWNWRCNVQLRQSRYFSISSSGSLRHVKSKRAVRNCSEL